jgi:hypothetical protein
MCQLNKVTLQTFHDRERTVKFGFASILAARKIVRKRLDPEIEEGIPERRIAIAACFTSVLFVFHGIL